MSLGSVRRACVARVPFALLLGAAVRAQSPVLVVDIAHPPPAPGVDYAQISQAVAAAAGGEIILVHPGSYQPFTVDGKSLTIVATGVVTVTDNVTIRGLLSDQSVLMRGFTMGANGTNSGLHVDGCAGPVWIEDCRPTGGFIGPTPDGLQITDSLAVTLVRCSVKGGTGVYAGPFASHAGAPGTRIRSSLVSAWEFSSIGGDGAYDNDNGGSGGSGLLLWPGANFTASAGLCQGGTSTGGDEDFDPLCSCFHCFLGGVGGTGLAATSESGSTCSGELHGVSLAGGTGLSNPFSGCYGDNGKALTDPLHHVAQTAAPLRRLVFGATAKEGGSLAMTVAGQPDDGVIVLAGLQPGFTPLSYGTLSVMPLIVSVIGALPAGGQLDLGFTVPELGPGVEGLLVVAQPFFVPEGGGKRLGSPSATVLLDSQF